MGPVLHSVRRPSSAAPRTPTVTTDLKNPARNGETHAVPDPAIPRRPYVRDGRDRTLGPEHLIRETPHM